MSAVPNTVNDAEIAAALAAVEEADAAALACASGATNGAVVVAGGAGKGGSGDDNIDDADSSCSRGAAAAEATAANNDDNNSNKSDQPQPQPPPAFERPTDEQIVAQENEIRAAIAGSAALVGPREPLSALRDEYRSGDAAVFAAKAEALSTRYRALRRARGDGNCFFRSFMFALAEGLLERRDLTERNRVVTRIRQSAKKMTDAGFDAIVFEDALEGWCDQLNRIGLSTDEQRRSNQPPLTLEELEAASGEDSGGFADMGVMLLRLLTSAELRSRAEFFEPFVLADAEHLDGVSDIGSFCARRVEPMGCESDHVHIVALTDALGVAVRVEYLDRSEEEGEGEGGGGGSGGGGGNGGGGGGGNPSPNHHDFVPKGAKSPPSVTLLYRPGHYDILYPI